MTPLIRAAALLHFDTLCRDLNADPQRILKQVGLSLEEIQEPDALVSAKGFVDALQLASIETNRDDFGLQLGMRQDINMLGPIGLLARQCDTAREAIEIISRYMNLHNPGAAVDLLTNQKKTLLCYDDITGGHTRNPQLCDLSLSLSRQVISLFFQKRWHPDAVFFIHKAPENIKTYQKFFEAPVYFNQEIYALKFDTALLDIKLKNSDKRLRAFFQNYVDSLNANHKEDTVSKVQHLIRSLLCSGYCCEKHIASILQITPRTLQRQLKKQDTTFKTILAKIRLELAKQYLTQSHISLTEISQALGYSELSAFTRFFKREIGLSPSAYQKNPLSD